MNTHNKQAVVGIDVGGTNTKVGILDENGNVLAFTHFPSEAQQEFSDFLKKLKENVRKLSRSLQNKYELQAVGVGSPNANMLTGMMENPPNFSWGDQVPFVKGIEKMLGLPVIISNDADAAAIGEMHYGAAKEMSDFIVLTLGTGLGGGIVIDRELLVGHSGIAGEIGHINVERSGRQCNCGLKGCLETYASVTGIRRTVFKLMADWPTPSPLRDYSFHELTGNVITDAALQGDPIAQKAFAYTGEMLGTKLADLAALFNPEAIILAGGLTRAGTLLLEPAKKVMDKRMFKSFRGKIKLIISKLEGHQPAILGAGALAWGLVEKTEKEEV